MTMSALVREIQIHRRYGFSTVLKFWLAQTGRSRHWNRNKRPRND
jgi:hypothetical protein